MESRWRRYVWKKGNDYFGFLHRIAGRGEKEGQIVLYPAWGRIGVLVSTLGIIGYVGLATTIWYHLRWNRQYTSIQWTDVAFPWNWREMRNKQGNDLIASVGRLFEAQRYREGIFNLIAGVRLAPENLEGRVLLAAIQREMGRHDLSAMTLDEGWQHASGNIEYMGTVLQAHLALQQEDRVVQLAQEWFAKRTHPSGVDRVVLFAWATALGNLRHPEAALQIVRQHALDATETGIALVAQILWVNDLRERAVRYLEETSTRFPNSDLLLVRLAGYQRELGRRSAAETTLLTRTIAQPDSPVVLADLIWWYHENGNTDAMTRGVETFLARFGNDRKALGELVRGASGRGLVNIADRGHELALRQGWQDAVFSMARIEARISAGQFQDGLREIAEIQRMRPSWLPEYLKTITSLQLIGTYGIGNATEGDTILVNLLALQRITPQELNTVAVRLVSLGVERPARAILERSLRLDPTNAQALPLLVDMAIRSRNSDEVLELIDRILAQRRPNQGTLNRAIDLLRSDFSVFVQDRDVLLSRVEQRKASLLQPQPLPPMPPAQAAQN